MVFPTKSGVMVERRLQVLMGCFFTESFIASTFFSRWVSTKAPFFKKVWQDLLEYYGIEKHPNQTFYFIAHNCYYFDQIVLEKELYHHGMELPKNVKFIDTLVLFRHYFPGLESYSLENLYYFFTKKKLDGAHRSDVDVSALVEILCSKLLDKCDITTPIVNYKTFSEVKYLGKTRSTLIYNKTKAENVPQLRKMLKEKKISPYMFGNWLESNLGMYIKN